MPPKRSAAKQARAGPARRTKPPAMDPEVTMVSPALSDDAGTARQSRSRRAGARVGTASRAVSAGMASPGSPSADSQVREPRGRRDAVSVPPAGSPRVGVSMASAGGVSVSSMAVSFGAMDTSSLGGDLESSRGPVVRRAAREVKPRSMMEHPPHFLIFCRTLCGWLIIMAGVNQKECSICYTV